MANDKNEYYSVPSADQPCCHCKHSRYDSANDELWCSHDPEPVGLRYRNVVDNWGHCGYWESEEIEVKDA
jgi:hypothetical protein